MWTLFVFLGVVTYSSAFNLNTKFPIFFKGKDRSYFGYSVALKIDQGKPPVILVAATRANSSKSNTVEPGVVYKCNLINQGCQEISLQPKGSKFHPHDDNMWLGMSLDVSNDIPQKVIACAPRWRNKDKQVSHLYPGNGICYVIDDQKQTAEQLAPFEDISKQALYNPLRYYYAFAQCGFSAQFSQVSKHVMLGSPGFSNWIGTVATYAYQSGNELIGNDTQIPIFPEKKESIEDNRYAGYSVTSGKFFEGDGIWFVAAAPRDNFYRGRVYIYQMKTGSSQINVKVHLEGQQMGEYFGSSVLGIDMDGNKFTDLLVGAPLYSQTDHEPRDFGRVDVFISNGVGLQQKQSLYGLRKNYARFGSSIANAGDLNQDGFHDVAIGAPYEDGIGVVYIYHGSSTGLNAEYSQRISASDIASNPPLKGFGISISRGLDVDSNYYSDLLVGAYSSDRAILFRSNPIVTIEATLKSDLEYIDTASDSCKPQNDIVGRPCTKLNYCFPYNGRHLPQFLDISIHLELETKQRNEKSPVRACFKGIGNRCTFLIQQNIRISQGNACKSAEIYIQTNAVDYLSPLQFKMNFTLTTNKNEFCKECPVLDVKQSSRVEKEVPFQVNCEGKPCISDLNLQAEILELRSKDSIIIGVDKLVTLKVTLRNDGDSAYFSSIRISLPSDINVINAAFCVLDKNEKATILNCDTGNPLKRDHEISFQIKLDVSGISTNTKEILVDLESKTISKDVNLANNRLQLEIPCESRYQILLSGLVDPGLLFYNEETYDAIPFTQKYQVSSLYSPISKISLRFSLPIAAKGKQKFPVFNITSVQASGTAVCFGDYDVLRSTHKNEDTKPKNEKTYLVDCETHECQMIECSASSSGKSDTAVITINGYLNVTSVRIQSHNATEEIQINSDGLAIGNEQTERVSLVVKLIKEGSVGSRSVPLWVIILSSVLGVAILVVIVVILAKYGFFKRSKKEELLEMQNDTRLLNDGK